MKTIDYLKPEIQVITLKAKAAILVGSDGDDEEAQGTGEAGGL